MNDGYNVHHYSIKVMAEADASNGNDDAKRALQILSRKMVKRPVMTYTYGVTAFGAREQIDTELRQSQLTPKEWTLIEKRLVHENKLHFSSS